MSRKPSIQSLGGRTAAARMTAEAKTARAKKGAAARWGKRLYEIETRDKMSGNWTDDNIGENQPRSLRECRADLEGLRGLIPEDSSWAAEYRIVRVDSDGITQEVVEYRDLSL